MVRIIAAILALTIAVAGFVYTQSGYHRVYLPAAGGITAKQVCSLTFVSGLDSDRGRAMYIDPVLTWASDLVHHTVDEDNKEVRASLLGFLYPARAVYREGLGCTIVHQPSQFDFDLTAPVETNFQPMTLDTAHRNEHFDADAIEAAIDVMFATRENHHTLGVVILHESHLIAERYADGVEASTPLHGWSMTKSAITTLAGRMAHEGRFDPYAGGVDGTYPEHPNSTADLLLRMTGGLDLDEDNSGMDPNSRMLFSEPDMVAFARSADRLHEPGEVWDYMSGDTVMTTYALQTRMGDTLLEQVAGLRETLFEPLGIYSAILEADQTGTFQGSSYMYAAAQDWARLAQLQLQDGVWEGERLLPENWVEENTAETEGSNGWYGRGFWLPGDDEGVPETTFQLSGFQGQYGMVVPDHDLVIVRLGATTFADAGIYQLTRDVIAAMVEVDEEVGMEDIPETDANEMPQPE